MSTSRLAVLALAVAASACSPRSAGGPASDSTQSSVLRIEEGFVDANGVLIYYKAFGTGQPLVILHGGPGAHLPPDPGHGSLAHLRGGGGRQPGGQRAGRRGWG